MKSVPKAPKTAALPMEFEAIAHLLAQVRIRLLLEENRHALKSDSASRNDKRP
jgi:hypothetical protein